MQPQSSGAPTSPTPAPGPQSPQGNWGHHHRPPWGALMNTSTHTRVPYIPYTAHTHALHANYMPYTHTLYIVHTCPTHLTHMHASLTNPSYTHAHPLHTPPRVPYTHVHTFLMHAHTRAHWDTLTAAPCLHLPFSHTLSNLYTVHTSYTRAHTAHTH